MTSTELSLAELHDQNLKTITSSKGDWVEYLLDAQEFLKNNDREGYIKAFNIEPAKCTVIPTDVCMDCSTPLVFTGENANASGVCPNCGLVAWEGLGENMRYNIKIGGTFNLHRIHCYKRFVNFKDILRRIQGNNNCLMNSDHRIELERRLFTI